MNTDILFISVYIQLSRLIGNNVTVINNYSGQGGCVRFHHGIWWAFMRCCMWSREISCGFAEFGEHL